MGRAIVFTNLNAFLLQYAVNNVIIADNFGGVTWPRQQTNIERLLNAICKFSQLPTLL